MGKKCRWDSFLPAVVWSWYIKFNRPFAKEKVMVFKDFYCFRSFISTNSSPRISLKKWWKKETFYNSSRNIFWFLLFFYFCIYLHIDHFCLQMGRSERKEKEIFNFLTVSQKFESLLLITFNGLNGIVLMKDEYLVLTGELMKSIHTRFESLTRAFNTPYFSYVSHHFRPSEAVTTVTIFQAVCCFLEDIIFTPQSTYALFFQFCFWQNLSWRCIICHDEPQWQILFTAFYLSFYLFWVT